MVFSIATCPKCGLLQTIQINSIKTAVLRCVGCNKNTKIHKSDGTLVALHGFYDDARVAIDVCKEMKTKEYADSLI